MEGFRGLSTIRNEQIDKDFRPMEIGLVLLTVMLIVYTILLIVEALMK